MLDLKRERIQDDLRGLIDGDVFANTVETQAFATDGSLYEIQPACVVCPKTTMDIVSVIRYARKNGLSVHPRGAGSNCVGATLGEGIVLDMSRHMRRLLLYQAETNILHVQAGMQCSRLNEILRPHGRQLLPGAGNSWPNTIGGLLSMDGYGSRWLAFGRPSDWLLELELVTANGNIVTFTNQEIVTEMETSLAAGIKSKNRDTTEAKTEAEPETETETTTEVKTGAETEPQRSLTGKFGPFSSNHKNAKEERSRTASNSVVIPDFSKLSSEDAIRSSWKNDFEESEEIFNPEKLAEPEPFFTPQEEKKWILNSVSSVLNEYRQKKESRTGLRVIDKMGYRTNIQNDSMLNMARLIAGAEGTLGVITAVKLQLPEIPAVRKTLLILFTSMEKAMQAVPLLLPFHPEACELIDRRYLHLATERDVRFDSMFCAKTEAALLVELSDSSQFSMMNRLRSISEQIIRQKDLAFQIISSVDDVEASFFWELVGTFEPSVQYGKGKPVRITIVEDVAVTPSKLYEFFLKIQELLRRHEITAAFYAHAVQGQVRLQPLADLHTPEDGARVIRFAQEYYELVHAMNGTIGTENGLGLGWKFWMPIFQNKNYELTCSIKRIFDPFALFQPGKMGSEFSEKDPKNKFPELSWRLSLRPQNAFSRDLTTVQVSKKSDSSTLPKITPPVSTSAQPDKEILAKSTMGNVSGNESKNESKNESEKSTSASVSTNQNTSQRQSVLEETPHTESASDANTNESGIFVMEKVREILGNAFDDFAGDSYGVAPYGSGEVEKNVESDGDEELESLTRLGLDWNSEQIQRIADRCNGCGKCRGTSPFYRTCPIFRYDCSEFSSPRAKVNLLEGILNETLDLAEFGDEAFHNIIHQCIQCHSCRVECPSGVDVPFLVRRAEEAWARARGLNFYETSLVRLDVWVKRFRTFPYFANLFFSTPGLRWVLEKTFGIYRGRQLPRLENRSFLEKLRRNPTLLAPNPFEESLEDAPVFYETTSGIQGRAVYFLDTFANYFDTEIAHAAVEVFRHNRIPVVVPQRQEGSGLTAVMLGRSDYARKQIFRNAATLADYVRQGYDVIMTEPATTLAFRWEFPQTYPENEDIALLAKHCFDAGEYLYKLHVLQLLKIPKRTINLKVGYHAPCRLKALKIGLPFVHLMGLIPGLEIHQSPHGCCGMGGTYGMMAENFTASQKIGRPLQAWLRNPTIQIAATECSACRLQMIQNSTKQVLHPIRLLAQAYGLEK